MTDSVFDIETNGLELDDVTTIHCLVINEVGTGNKRKFDPSQIEEGLRLLEQSDRIIGHNIIKYDLRVIKKLYPWFKLEIHKVVDTLVLSRLFYTDMGKRDYDKNSGAVAQGLAGLHSLEAWGARLGVAKVEHEDWATFSPEMLHRCSVDVDINEKLYDLLLTKNIDPRAWKLEHELQFVIAEQEAHGFAFDLKKAHQFVAKLQIERVQIEAQLQETFKPFYTANGKPVEPKRSMKRKSEYDPSVIIEVTQGHSYQKIKLTPFNPGSRFHVAARLKVLYGWEPQEFTPTGEPKVDDSVLEDLPWPEAKLLCRYYLIQKRLALVAEGDNGWLKLVKPNGRLYGSMITNGAVTGRCTHKIIANVPRVTTEFGPECRELLMATTGLVQLGVDASGLELRMLAHFLSRWDGGKYAKIVCEGDPHTVNMHAAGLPSRDAAKTFIYAFLYGAGDAKLGSIVEPTASRQRQIEIGKRLKKDFIKKTPGLNKLIAAVKETIKTQGYLLGLDGRILNIRAQHAALNMLLQSAGAVVCKQWVVELDAAIRETGWKSLAQLLIFYHDEQQFEHDKVLVYDGFDHKGKPALRSKLGDLAIDCITRAGNKLGIRVPLSGEYKVGYNWKECH